MPQILVVDDDRGIRGLLAEFLDKNGFRTLMAADGSGMWRALAASRPDLLVLDLNLPGEDGLALCRGLREKSGVPVIMLTARSSAEDRIRGLEMGADDYLAKPFDPRELLARIKSILRRLHALPPAMPGVELGRMQFSGWSLDLQARHLLDGRGIVVSLSSAEFRLLKAFLELPNRTLSREQLLSLAWTRQADVFDRSIDLLVSRLRQKLGDDAKSPRIIQTVRNAGYVLASSVRLLPPQGADKHMRI